MRFHGRIWGGCLHGWRRSGYCFPDGMEKSVIDGERLVLRGFVEGRLLFLVDRVCCLCRGLGLEL